MAAAPGQGAERRLEERSADGIKNDVRALPFAKGLDALAKPLDLDTLAQRFHPGTDLLAGDMGQLGLDLVAPQRHQGIDVPDPAGGDPQQRGAWTRIRRGRIDHPIVRDGIQRCRFDLSHAGSLLLCHWQSCARDAEPVARSRSSLAGLGPE